MADFKKAFQILEKWEGGYSNHISDTGGETYKGITRKNYPKMSFWSKIDLIKKESKNISLSEVSKRINSILGNNQEVEEEIEAFYKKHYWDTYNGDEISCQEFAANLLLLTVNAGLKRGLIVGQKACGILADGKYGNQTKEAFLNANKENVILFNQYEKEFYKNLVKKNPQSKVFLKGWIKRAESV